MKQDTYSLEIQNCIDKILEIGVSKPDLTIGCCRKLLKYGTKQKDDYLLGVAYYYMGEAYYFSGVPKQQVFSLFNSLEYLKSSENYNLLARAYNLLGILSNAQGNPSTALDYFLQGLSVCHSQGLHYVAGMLYSNIALLFTQIENYEESIEYLQNAIKNYQKVEPSPNQISNMTASYLALGQSYLRMKNLREALSCMKKVDDYLPEVDEEYIGITICVFRAQLAHAMKHFSERDNYIQEILSLPLQEYSLLTFYDDFLNLVHFLLDIKSDSALLKILDTLEEMAVQCQNLYIQVELVKVRLSYYQRTNQDFLFLHNARKFYELSIKRESENQKTISDSLELRFSLVEMKKQQEQAKHENLKLLIKSELDALTGLPNRYKMNDYSVTLLCNAVKNQVPLAIEILDVDYFKQYNDTYGHQAGDGCLVSIAHALDSIACDDVFCARYGGDEFIVIYYNKTKEEVIELAKNLQTYITDLHLEHKNSPFADFVTVTQGLVYCMPKETSRMWDLFHIADCALYEGKRVGRNSITLKTID